MHLWDSLFCCSAITYSCQSRCLLLKWPIFVGKIINQFKFSPFYGVSMFTMLVSAKMTISIEPMEGKSIKNSDNWVQITFTKLNPSNRRVRSSMQLVQSLALIPGGCSGWVPKCRCVIGRIFSPEFSVLSICPWHSHPPLHRIRTRCANMQNLPSLG